MDKEASQERAEVKWAKRMSNLDRMLTKIGLIIILTLYRTDLTLEKCSILNPELVFFRGNTIFVSFVY